MKIKSIQKKIFLSISVILSVFIIGIFMYGITFKSYYIDSKIKEMNAYVDKIETLNPTAETLQKMLEEFLHERNIQLEIRQTSDDVMLLSSGEVGGKGYGKGKQKYEVVERLASGKTYHSSIVHSKNSSLDYLLVEVSSASQEIYYRLITPISLINESVSLSIKLLLMIFIPLMLLVFIMAFFFSKKLSSPIIKITNKTKEIEQLKFTEPLEIYTHDELGRLSESINQLSDSIKVNIEALELQNQQLMEAMNKEKQMEGIRKEFISSVSHELKTPITIISGYADALKKRIVTEPTDVDYYLSMIDEEATRMTVIVYDLLDLYKYESKTYQLRPSEFDLSDLIRSSLIKHQLKIKEAQANVTVQGDKVIIQADQIRIEQAFVNYLNNAICHLKVPYQIVVEIKVEADDVVVSIFNSGDQISEEDMEKIWLGFVRLNQVRHYKENRVGLGLAIVKEIINLHGGSCGVINKENGVEFYFTIPLCHVFMKL